MRRTHAPEDRASSISSEALPSRSADPGWGSPSSASKANERFSMLFERASVGIIAVGADGRAVEANPAVERMLGCGPGEVTNRSFTAFTYPDDVPASRDLYRDLLDDEHGSYQYEKRYIRKDGEVIWCRVSVWRDAARTIRARSRSR